MISLKIKSLIVLTIVLTMHCSISFGQDRTSICNHKLYSRYINHAEMAITDSIYPKALIYYDSAFYNSSAPFCRDRYNVAVCNALIGNYNKCQQGLTYLLEKGLDIKVVTKNPAFSDFLLSEHGKVLQGKRIVLTYDTILRGIYDSILDEDQRLRKIEPINAMAVYGETICKIDAGNVNRMNQLIDRYGWPTEDLIGVIDFETLLYYEFIIIHQCSKENQVYDYTEDITNAYNNCQLDAYKAAYLISRSTGKSDLKVLDTGIVTIVYDSLGTFKNGNLSAYQHKIGFDRLTDERRALINRNREEFGLESLESFQKKVLFSLKDNRFHFHYLGGRSIWTFPSRADYEFNENKLISY